MSTEDRIRKTLERFVAPHALAPSKLPAALLDDPASPLNNGDFILALADRHALRVGLSYPIDGGERERGKT